MTFREICRNLFSSTEQNSYRPASKRRIPHKQNKPSGSAQPEIEPEPIKPLEKIQSEQSEPPEPTRVIFGQNVEKPQSVLSQLNRSPAQNPEEKEDQPAPAPIVTSTEPLKEQDYPLEEFQPIKELHIIKGEINPNYSWRRITPVKIRKNSIF